MLIVSYKWNASGMISQCLQLSREPSVDGPQEFVAFNGLRQKSFKRWMPIWTERKHNTCTLGKTFCEDTSGKILGREPGRDEKLLLLRKRKFMVVKTIRGLWPFDNPWVLVFVITMWCQEHKTLSSLQGLTWVLFPLTILGCHQQIELLFH